ncbi:conserved Plasmodium protein, unknown function [Plasmodium relictum]|uniref:Uncharacterized protein n=1 Tax=Plasmodium relictum TaxID=85471 RepID=A0A1J1HCU7_PLARL|nr:conserved Plasmodium protein, unknown function [Plasmodium relictum]CRH03714.1 conserved Plasmodium protein, unknown function [Plasmodium relictum]
MLNKILNDILEKWERKEINLSNICLCFHYLKKDLTTIDDKNYFFINGINYLTFKKILHLAEDQNNSNNKNQYLYLIFTKFIFSLECDFIINKNFLSKHKEYYLKELDVYVDKKAKKGESKNNEVDILDKRDNAKEKRKKKLNKEKEDKNIVNTKNYDVNKKKTEDKNDLIFFEKIDILIKNLIDLKINSNDNNEFLNYKIYSYYSILKFIYYLSENEEKISKFFFKHIKNILFSIINVNLSVFHNEHTMSIVNKIIFIILNLNVHVIKDYEKEFFNFLYMQLSQKKVSLDIIKDIIVLYLKKKNNIILNNEIYKDMNNYANDNINLFLKYGSKENLYFFLNAINIYEKLINSKISNTNNNLYVIKHMEYVNINLSIKDIVLNINKLLEYLMKISKDYINNEKMSIYLNDTNYIYDKEEKKNVYNIENVLRTINKKKKCIYIDNLNADKNSSSNINNIFSCITDNIFNFFRGVTVKLNSEIISINANYFVNFMKFFFIYNNENDLFLSYFLNNNIYIYAKELLNKCFAIFDEFVNYIVYIFRIVNVLTQNKLLVKNDLKENKKEEDEKLSNILNKIKEVVRCDNITDIYYKLYNNNIKVLCLFLKYLSHYTNETIKEKILIHYEHFIFFIFNERDNINFNLIFKNNISFYLTLRMLYTFVKIKNCNFENVHNIYFKLSKLETELNINEECSFFYKNKLFNNVYFIKKIKIFLSKNLDSIFYDKKIYINKKEKFAKFEKQLAGKMNKTNENLLKKKKKNSKSNDDDVYDRKRVKTTYENSEILTKETLESDQMNEYLSLSSDKESSDSSNESELLEKKKNKNIKKSYVEEHKEWSNENDTCIRNEEIKMNNEEENKGNVIKNKEKKEKTLIHSKYDEEINKGKNRNRIKKKKKINNNNNNNILDKQEQKDIVVKRPIISNLNNKSSVKSVNGCISKLKSKTRNNKEKPKNSYSKNSNKNTINLNKLNNIKIVSSSDAINSLNYMKQSILSDL